MGRLDGKVAIVTGSARGIGRGIAILLAKEGAKVVVNDFGGGTDGTGGDKGPADQVVDEIKAAGGTAVANYDSVASAAGGENIIKTALDSFGKLDILVNNAGILRDRMIFNMTEEEWDAVIAVHLKGHFATTKPASVIFRQQRSGRIINFSSTSGLIGNAGQANYGAAKGGIGGFTRVVARDLGRYGVTVNAIAPLAATRLTATIPAASLARSTGASAGRPKEDMEATIKGMGIVGVNHPDDIAPMVAYLCTDEAANINGQIFYVGGGVVGLMNHYTAVKQIFSPVMWTVDMLKAIFPQTLGEGLINPAPPAPPPPPQS